MADYFSWYHQAMSPESAWMVGIGGAFLAAVGIAMALSPFLQMWFGRGKMIPTFRVEHHNADRSLQIFLANPPVKEGSWLDRTGRRT